jgi:hypothetical protein
MKRFSKCEKLRKDPIISLSENKSKIIFENPQKLEVCVLEVDGCAIEQGPRCDYALVAESIEDEFYIELKGRDIKHAFEQLESTLKQISAQPSQTPKYCFVISTRCPLSGPEIQKMQKMMQRKYKARLIIKNREYTHTLTSQS